MTLTRGIGKPVAEEFDYALNDQRLALSFKVTPMAKQSARFFFDNQVDDSTNFGDKISASQYKAVLGAKKSRRRPRVYIDQTVVQYETNLLKEALSQRPKNFKPFRGPFGAWVEYYFSMPKRFRTRDNLWDLRKGLVFYKDTKPDLDSNLNKPLFDALEPRFIEHDAKLCVLHAFKYWDLEPHIELKLWEL